MRALRSVSPIRYAQYLNNTWVRDLTRKIRRPNVVHKKHISNVNYG